MYNVFLHRGYTLPHISRTVFLPYTPAQLFELVADIDHYADFLPYCTASYILSEQGEKVEASLRVGYKNMGYTFTSHNHNQPPDTIHMTLSQGPFSQLEGEWRFTPHAPTGVRVDLHLTIVFKHGLIGLALNRKLDEVTDLMVNAFSERARVIYG